MNDNTNEKQDQIDKVELLEKILDEPLWMQCLRFNVFHLKESLKSPFVFVVAVNPDDGAFQVATHSDRKDVADIMTEEFGIIMEEKIVPFMKDKIIASRTVPSKIVRPDGRPYPVPGARKKSKRPPRKQQK
jgi:hypothetical protein